MRELILDGSDWKTRDDAYYAWFNLIRAPKWHGRNLNAVRDGILGGEVNAVETPYRIVIRNSGQIGADAKEMAKDFVDVIREIARDYPDCPVEIRVEP